MEGNGEERRCRRTLFEVLANEVLCECLGKWRRHSQVMERGFYGGRTNAHLRLHALELFCIHLESTVAPQLRSCVEPI